MKTKVTPELVSDLISECMGGCPMVMLPRRKIRAVLDLVEQAMDYESLAERQKSPVAAVLDSTIERVMAENRRLWRENRKLRGQIERKNDE